MVDPARDAILSVQPAYQTRRSTESVTSFSAFVFVAPVITSGNTVIVLASTKAPLSAMTFAEVLATSDLPAGVVNILTGKKEEIAPWMASHMDIDALDISGLPAKQHADIKFAGAENR